MKRKRCFLTVLCLGWMLSWHSCFADTLPDRDEWDRAVQLGRDGQFDASLQLFQQLRKVTPHNQGLIGDQAVILMWAGRPAEALAVAAELDLTTAPDYVLDNVARAARDSKEFTQAAEYYQLAAQRFPENWQFRLGWLLSLAEAGNTDAALAVYLPLRTAQPDNAEVFMGGGYLYRLRREYLESADAYGRVLTLAPDRDEAYRLRVLALIELGAAEWALREAERRPTAFSEADWRRLHGDRSAAAVRWGELPSPTLASRYAETDESITRIDADLARLPADAAVERRRARLDRIIAWRDRQQMEPVLAEYADLQAEKVELPPYVLNAVADAYLYLQQPEKAVELYKKVLEATPGQFGAQIGLFYAYIESEDFDSAYALIDKVAAAQPVWRQQGGGPARPNQSKLDSDMTAALARAYGNQLPEAQERLEALVTDAPLNAGLRGELAGIYRQRGWSELALGEYNRARAVDDEALSLQMNQVGVLLDLDRPEQVAERIETLARLYPENKHVQQLARDWHLRNHWRLRSEATYGKSNGSTVGSQDKLWDTVVHAPTFDWHYRPFLHAYYSHATLPEGEESYDRLGAGLDYAHDRWQWQAELSAERESGDDPGLELELGWQPDDYWRFGARLATFSTDVPLRAYLQGIDGMSYRLNAGYRLSESRAFSSSLGYLDMSDGNDRWSAQLAWQERLVSQPHYLLNSQLELYGSTNSRDNVIYFNPSRDAALTLTLINDWIGYRRYDRRLTHRLVVTPGVYWQEDVGTDWIAALRYEHDWNIDAATGLRYGVGWASNVYDGDREERVHAYVTFEWRF